MTEATFKATGGIDAAEESPGWSCYTIAVNAILDCSADEWDMLAQRAECHIDKVKKQREKLLEMLGKVDALVNQYGLKRITIQTDDPVGILAREINNVSNDILSVFATTGTNIEQLCKALPSDKRARSTETKLNAAGELIDITKNRLTSIFIEFPARLHQIAKELHLHNRLDEGDHFLKCKQCLDAIHKDLLYSQDTAEEMPLSHVLTVVGDDVFHALEVLVDSAEKEYKQIKKEEERLRKQRELEEKRRRAEEALLEAERRKKEEVLEADRKSICELLKPLHYSLPLAALVALIALSVYIREWAAFGASMTTLAFSIASGLLGILMSSAKRKKKSDLPKFFCKNEIVFGFGFVAPLLFAVLQFVSAIIMAIVVFIFKPQLHPFLEAVLPLGKWSRFFGFVVLGPLACLTACTATIAVYYLALIKPMRSRMKAGPPLS